MPEKLGIRDFGSQYTQTIARRAREQGVYCEIFRSGAPARRSEGCKSEIFSGGPSSVYDKGAPRVPEELWEDGKPKLGVCYGMQLEGERFGCGVAPGAKREYGKNKITVVSDERLFAGTPREQVVWMSHGDSVKDPSAGNFMTLAVSEHGIPAAMRHRVLPLYGVQFHPEVHNTEHGVRILQNFLYGISGFKADWKMEDYLERAEREIEKMVGNREATVAASGGVDSTTLAYLANRRLEGKLKVTYLDMGQGRKGEREWVRERFAELGFENVDIVDISEETFKRMEGLLDANQIRKTFSEIYASQLDKEVAAGRMLIQGSLYPDFVESGYSLQWSEDVGEQFVVGSSDEIKPHHNISKMDRFRKINMLCEPFRYLFKDEVRNVSRKAGLPPEISERRPFPGPGLYIRHCGNVKKLDNHHDVEAFVHEIAKKHGLQGYLLPVLSVGVQGDQRTYRPMAILSGENDWQRLRAATHEIISSTRDVNAVAYCLTHDELNRDELRNTQPMPISRETLALLRDIDDAATGMLELDPAFGKVSQCPVSLLAGRWGDIRDFRTEDFMTGRPLEKPEEISWDTFHYAADAMMYSRGLRGVLLTLSDKPPTTTEKQ